MLSRVERGQHRILHPRPVYLIVSRHGDRVNVMAASWVTPVSEEPPRIALALDRETYTYRLVRESGYFTVNVVGEDMVDAVWIAGTVSGEERDKVSLIGLRLADSEKVPVPHVEGCLGYIGAKVWRTMDVGDAELVVADVVEAYADPSLFDPRKGWYLAKARVLLHGAGRVFATTGRILYPSRRG